MEEHRCNTIVYFCATAQDEVYELYHKTNPPSEAAAANSSLGQVYENVRTLLDEDIGGFEEGKAKKMKN